LRTVSLPRLAQRVSTTPFGANSLERNTRLKPTDSRKICILGTLHDYQYKVVRDTYLQTVNDLITIHEVDLVAEEASGVPNTYAKQWVETCRNKLNRDIQWKNVDLTREERKELPDVNPYGIGTLVDLDFQITRERAWIARTSQEMKESALLICGWVHTLSVAEKFRSSGFVVEVNVYFDKKDQDRIANAPV
jgi:hypothetical protein